METMRVTLSDVARVAGVSTATVDRVLNNRGGVRGRTRNHVMAIALRLGYIDPTLSPGDGPTGLDTSPVTLDFLLPGGPNRFIEALAEHLRWEAAASQGVTARIHSLKGFDPGDLAAGLNGLHGRSQGVGIIGVDHPTVREAIQDLARTGVPLLTLVSDVSHVPRIGYVGIDNREAGRLAGYVLGRFVGGGAGSVAVFAGALAYRGHEEREMGFHAVLREHFPKLSVVVRREIRDDPECAYAETRAVLAAHADLVGLYNIGAGNRGIGRALNDMERAGKVVFVGHDVTEQTRQLLLSGTMDAALDQNPAEEARQAIRCLAAAARGEPVPVCAPLRAQMVCRENLPPAVSV